MWVSRDHTDRLSGTWHVIRSIPANHHARNDPKEIMSIPQRRCFYAVLLCLLANISPFIAEGSDFSEYCDPTLNEQLTDAESVTISALLRAASRLSGKSKIGCAEAGVILHELKTLNLSRVGDVGPGIGGMEPLSDLSPLPIAVPNVEELDLSGNDIRDLKPLHRLTRLRVLRLRAAGITSEVLATLPHLPKLEELWLSNFKRPADGTPPAMWAEMHPYENRIEQWTAESAFPRLRVLDLKRNRDLEKLEGIGAYGELRILDLQSNSIRSLAGLEDLSELTQLYANRNQLTDVQPISECQKLETLWLSDNKINELDGLRDLKRLTAINLANNNIARCDSLARMVDLEIVDLQGNRIASVDPLRKLTKLKKLWLHRNKINHIEPLQQASQLEVLWLNENPLAEIVVVSHLGHLKQLGLGNTPVREVTPVASLQYLEVLDLSTIEHQLDLSSFSALKKLRRLRLTGTKFTNLPQSLESIVVK